MEYSDTIFSEYLKHRAYDEHTDILPPAELWFDGCK